MKSFFDYLIHKPLFWVIALGLILPFLFFQDFHRPEEPRCKHPPVPPRVNVDGTIDHVVIQKCKGFKGRYVIVRLSADQAARLSKDMEPTEVGGFGGPTVTLSSSTNQYVVALYDMSNDWKPVSKAELKKLDRKLIAEITFTEWSDDLTRTSLERDTKDAEIACEAPIRHPNEMLEYRLKKGRDPRVYPRCFQTFIHPESARTYVSARPVAVLDCSAPVKESGHTGDCRGSVDTPEHIHIRVYFRNASEPSAEQIADAIAHVTEQVGKAFVEYGELQPDEIFSFEKIRGDAK